MTEERVRYDGLGIAMIGLAALLVVGVALGGFISAPRPPDDTSVQQSMAWASWAMVMVSLAGGAIGALSLYLIFHTLQAALRSAEAAEQTVKETRRIGEAQARCYMVIKEATLETDKGDWQVRFRFQNSGQTPAMNISTAIEITFQLEPAAPQHWSYEHRARSDTASQEVKNAVIPLHAYTLKSAQKDGDAVIWAHLRIDYADVFGEPMVAEATYQLAATPFLRPEGGYPISMMRHRDDIAPMLLT